jgi:penicillin-binding protein 1C
MKRWKRPIAIALSLLALPWIALLGLAAFTPLPAELARPRDDATGVEVFDRSGVLLRELRAGDGARARWVPLDAVGERAVRAVLAAEDRRYDWHPGVDPLAVARASLQAIAHRRVVSGASTITQQLARTIAPRPRTLSGKVREMALALRIEASLSKREILEQYMNRVAFGPGVRGIEAASRFYLDKGAADLSLAEAAALASLPRGPALYDPRKGTARLLRRRDRVLGRMAAAGLASSSDVQRALAEPLAIQSAGGSMGAPHLVRAVMSGGVDEGAGPLRNRASSITLTIDRRLQREVEVLAVEALRSLADKRVTAASVVVLENATGEILAYVGSPDIGDEARLGHNDGVTAARQPGSSLKPFVYELAMERLGYTAATALPDVELHFPAREGTFRPNNYDGRFHGPLRLREALGNSYNVPAVRTAAALGPDVVLERLQELGFQGLDRDPEHYGAAIALGDGETRLLDLANAYATLARGGVLLPVVAVKRAIGKDHRPLSFARPGPRRVLEAWPAFVIGHVLADRHARRSSFGDDSALELGFFAAAKTGTSKGFRDNVAVGFTREVTVAVWVGNFDGSPMDGVSGISGAGPLFRAAMTAAARGRPDAPWEAPAPVEEVSVCSLSGELPTAACRHTHREVFLAGAERGGAPKGACTMHETIAVDRRNGLRAGPGCDAAVVETRVFERFDADLEAWARSAGRPIAPERWSPRCPGGPSEAARARAQQAELRIAFPIDGSTFAIDPALRSRQELFIRADVPDGASGARVFVDGIAHALAPGERSVRWPLAPGAHTARVEAGGRASEPVEFSVE